MEVENGVKEEKGVSFFEIELNETKGRGVKKREEINHFVLHFHTSVMQSEHLCFCHYECMLKTLRHSIQQFRSRLRNSTKMTTIFASAITTAIIWERQVL